jgi:hypothetical protein
MITFLPVAATVQETCVKNIQWQVVTPHRVPVYPSHVSYVIVVLYHALLAASNTRPAVCDAAWNVISINANIV